MFTPTPTFAQRYRPDEGKEIAPGVRRVDLTKRTSEIPGYATVSMRDIVYQPGAKSENPAMANDMVCHCLEGELQVSQGPDTKFVAKTGDVWSCKKGMPEAHDRITPGTADHDKPRFIGLTLDRRNVQRK